MGDPKDPFDEDVDATIIAAPGAAPTQIGSRPSSEDTMILGGAAAPDRAPASPAGGGLRAALAERQAAADAGPVVKAGANPLIAAGAALLALGPAVKRAPSHPDPAKLREDAARALGAFEAEANRSGLSETDVRLGHYVLCAFIDDCVMSTPWGAQHLWSKQSLTAYFHNQVDAGDRLYDLAEKLEQAPNRHPEVLELTYLALSLGFEGRLRIAQRGPALLADYRARLFRAIRERRGPVEAGLSPQWRGAETALAPLARSTPLWAVAAVLAGLALAVFALLLFDLNRKSDVALSRLTSVTSPDIAGPADPAQPLAPSTVYPQIVSILQPDIDAGRVEVFDKPGRVVVRLRNRAAQEMFRSGTADPSVDYRDTFGRIAQAANLAGGLIQVQGHSDATPIATARFPSNWHLSKARAQAVADRILPGLADPDRVEVEALGASDPIADNATAEGRRENRRVEVVLSLQRTWE